MMENDKASQANDWLNTYAQKWKIFIDTCSLLTDSIDMFWSNILPHLNQYNSKVIIPYRCIQELEKFINDKSDMVRCNKAQKARDHVVRLYQSGFVDIRGDKNDNFADNVFQTVFTKFRMQYNMLLITQDNNLAKDIKTLMWKIVKLFRSCGRKVLFKDCKWGGRSDSSKMTK